MLGQCVAAQKNGVSHANRLLCFLSLLLLLLPLRSCLLTGALLSHCSIPGRCHYQPLTPPCTLVMKTFSAAAAASGPCSSSLLHCFLQRVHPHHGPQLSVGSLWPHFGGKATHHHLLPSPQWAGSSLLGTLTPLPHSRELCSQCLHSPGHCFVWMAQLLG